MRMLAFFAAALLLAGSVSAEGYVWDALRPVTEVAKQVELPVTYALFFVSLVIFAISFMGWRKSRSSRILLVSAAFFLFVLKWLIGVVDLHFSPGYFLADASAKVFDFGIMLLLFVAIFYRKSWSSFFTRDGK